MKPHCFGGKTGSDLGFDYSGNPKAWMDFSIFRDWHLRFNSYIAETEGRKVALLLDNASCHGTIDNLPE